MKNTFGNNITYTLFGESHGEEIGIVIDGLAPGMRVDTDFIKDMLSKRRPSGRISTARREEDDFRVVSGVWGGRTTGTPVCILIPNKNVQSKDYSKMASLPRPGHADFAAECKYHGFQDYRGGGHFSGRITAPLVAAGAMLMPALAEKGIYIGTHIRTLAGVKDRELDHSDLEKDIDIIKNSAFPALDDKCAAEMQKKAEEAAELGDSVGGILETVIIGMPAGVGEPWFDTVEGELSHILFSVPGVKGVEFGLGFGFANAYGSEANDAFVTDGETIKTKTNNNGGINGGITNGMPIIFRSAIKPTPSIYKAQDTVSLSAMENRELVIEGRHDPAIIHRARAVVDAVTAIALADMLAVKYGTDWLGAK